MPACGPKKLWAVVRLEHLPFIIQGISARIPCVRFHPHFRLNRRFPMLSTGQQLAAGNLFLKQGTIVDASLIAAPPSTREAEGQRDPDAFQSERQAMVLWRETACGHGSGNGLDSHLQAGRRQCGRFNATTNLLPGEMYRRRKEIKGLNKPGKRPVFVRNRLKFETGGRILNPRPLASHRAELPLAT